MRHNLGWYSAPQIVAWWCRPHDTRDQLARAGMAIVLAGAALRFASRRMPAHEQSKAHKLSAMAAGLRGLEPRRHTDDRADPKQVSIFDLIGGG